MRQMVAPGLDRHDEAAMTRLATECKMFGPAGTQAANDRRQRTKADIFALVSIMIKTMEEAANKNRDVHGGEVWKAFAKHLYS